MASSWRLWCLTLLLPYLITVKLLRYNRRDCLQKQFGYHDRASLGRMTLAEAHAIQTTLGEVEFPKIFSTSIFFALFKTYGIPSISSLLVSTGQLSSDATASKRAADTGIIITEVVLNKPSSPRAINGIARMNYLHDRYRKAGKISDEDMLYTLALFALEPIRWTNRYEWRTLTDMERCAMGMYWKDLGDAMEIPYTALKSGKDGWRDGLQWLDELEEWSDAYEEQYMVPAEANNQLANATLNLALFPLPRWIRGVILSFALVLLDKRLRFAMMLDDPPLICERIMHLVFNIRKYLLRHIALPRPYGMRQRWFTETPDPQTGLHHPMRYIAHPWYMKPSFKARWGLGAWVRWLSRKPLPGDEGKKYHPEGYAIREMGPEGLKDKGYEEMEKTIERLSRTKDRLSCPFAAHQSPSG
ncbi:hypothetical protein K490DRAFT_36961 [Saccharata proteae CBS 121410]|uniref:Uncharacterized protein n=1 Tax=Saccharata proteae CBS 121410 TaxID=1314787 RepID=A0A6A5YER6_9PEZI|nr:hypothetical protein K490DRAFT_36961 [Saccharata proteae CBS 121410]